MSYTLIALGGVVSDPVRLKERIADRWGTPGYIIAADSGYDHLRSMGMRPHLVLGDFDSIAEPDLPAGIECLRYPAQKNQTDSEIALREAFARRPKSDILVVGYGGGRHDHMIANLKLLARFSPERGGTIVCMDEVNELRYLSARSDAYRLAVRGRYFSVIPECSSVLLTIQGAKYPLERARIAPGDTLGVSNEALEDPIRLTIHEGACFLCWSSDSETAGSPRKDGRQ